MNPALDFVVIGAQKSASTALHRALRAHPEIHSPREEIPTFEQPFYSPVAVHRLESRLATAPSSRKRGIKRPTYLCLPEVPANLHRESPGARLIAVLRNPVDRALSAYYHYVRFGHLAPVHHEEGLRRLLDAPPSGRAREVLDFGLYWRGIRAWREYYAEDRLLLVRQDDLRLDFSEVMLRVLEHIDASPMTMAPPGRAPMEGAYNLRRLAVWRRVNPLLFKHGPLERIQERSWLLSRAFGFVDSRALSRVFPSEPPIMSTDLRARLLDHYAQDLRELEANTGLDISPWQAAR